MFSPLGSTASLLTFCFISPSIFFFLCAYVSGGYCVEILTVFSPPELLFPLTALRLFE